MKMKNEMIQTLWFKSGYICMHLNAVVDSTVQ